MKTLKMTLIAGAVAAAILSPTAHALDNGIEVQTGVTRFNSPPSGLWLRDKQGYPTKKRLYSDNVKVSFFHKLSSNLEGSFSAEYIGHYKTDGVAPGNETCAGDGGGPEMCGENSNYHTSGNMSAVGSELRYYFHMFGARPFVQGGLHITRQEFKLDVSEQQNGLPDYHYGPEVKYGLGKSVGVGFIVGKVTGTLSLYKSGADGKFYQGQYPAGVGQAYMATVGYRF